MLTVYPRTFDVPIPVNYGPLFMIGFIVGFGLFISKWCSRANFKRLVLMYVIAWVSVLLHRRVVGAPKVEFKTKNKNEGEKAKYRKID